MKIIIKTMEGKLVDEEVVSLIRKKIGKEAWKMLMDRLQSGRGTQLIQTGVGGYYVTRG